MCKTVGFLMLGFGLVCLVVALAGNADAGNYIGDYPGGAVLGPGKAICAKGVPVPATVYACPVIWGGACPPCVCMPGGNTNLCCLQVGGIGCIPGPTVAIGTAAYAFVGVFADPNGTCICPSGTRCVYSATGGGCTASDVFITPCC